LKRQSHRRVCRNSHLVLATLSRKLPNERGQKQETRESSPGYEEERAHDNPERNCRSTRNEQTHDSNNYFEHDDDTTTRPFSALQFKVGQSEEQGAPDRPAKRV
jgi:hypothetical protein